MDDAKIGRLQGDDRFQCLSEGRHLSGYLPWSIAWRHGVTDGSGFSRGPTAGVPQRATNADDARLRIPQHRTTLLDPAGLPVRRPNDAIVDLVWAALLGGPLDLLAVTLHVVRMNEAVVVRATPDPIAGRKAKNLGCLGRHGHQVGAAIALEGRDAGSLQHGGKARPAAAGRPRRRHCGDHDPRHVAMFVADGHVAGAQAGGLEQAWARDGVHAVVERQGLPLKHPGELVAVHRRGIGPGLLP
jgi:hypothetical protein